MILCACFYIDKTEWFEEQFLYSRHLYNQGRYVINNHYKETIITKSKELYKSDRIKQNSEDDQYKFTTEP